MRHRSVSTPGILSHAPDRTMLPGAGILLTGAVSLVMWGLIAGIAAIW